MLSGVTAVVFIIFLHIQKPRKGGLLCTAVESTSHRIFYFVGVLIPVPVYERNRLCKELYTSPPHRVPSQVSISHEVLLILDVLIVLFSKMGGREFAGPGSTCFYRVVCVSVHLAMVSTVHVARAHNLPNE